MVRVWIPLLLLACAARADTSVANDAGKRGSVAGGLRFELSTAPLAANPSFVELRARAVSWRRDGGEVVWRVLLPDAWQKRTALERRYAANAELAEGQVRAQFHPLVRADAVVLAALAELLVLDRAGGHVLLDWRAATPDKLLFFDTAEITIDDAGGRHTAHAAGSFFLVDTGARLYLVTGAAVAVFDAASYKWIATGVFQRDAERLGRIKDFRAHASAAGATVAFTGIILD